MVISIFFNYQQQQISVYAQQVVKISRRSDGGKSTKMSFKHVRYGAQKTVSKHLKQLPTRKIGQYLYTRKHIELKYKTVKKLFYHNTLLADY